MKTKPILTAMRERRGGHENTPDGELLALFYAMPDAMQAEYLEIKSNINIETKRKEVNHAFRGGSQSDI
jgi:hypothetical protein